MRKNVLAKRIVSFTLILIMAVGLVGCNKSTAQDNDKVDEGGKPEKIKFTINVGLKDGDELKWKKEYERLTGITLEYSGPITGTQYYTSLDMSLSNKTAPDVFNLGGGMLATYVGKGAVADLTELFEKSFLKDRIDPAVMESVTIDGKIYGIPFENGGGTITYIREDWLKECGLDVPTNYEEFIQMLKAFKAKYPDKIPFTAPTLYENKAYMYLREFYQDANPDFVQVNGRWVDGMSLGNMEAALQRLQDAYTSGLIDIEAVTNTTTSCRDKWFAGEVGVFTYWAGTWAISMEDRLIENVPEASVIQLPAIEEASYVVRVPAVTCISSAIDNVEEVFQYFIEYMHDGGEGQLLFESGVENVHYKIEGNTLIQLPRENIVDEVYQKAFIAPFLRVTDLKDELTIDYDERIVSSNEILKKKSQQLVITPESETYLKHSEEIDKLKETVISKIVTGVTSVEEGLVFYKKEVEKLQMATILLEMNK